MSPAAGLQSRESSAISSASSQHPACLAKRCLSEVSSANSSHLLAPAKQHLLHLHSELQATLLLSASTVYLCLSLGSRLRQRLYGPGHRVQQATSTTYQQCDNGYLPTRATSSLVTLVLPASVELDCDYGYWAVPAKSLHHLLYVVECKAWYHATGGDRPVEA